MTVSADNQMLNKAYDEKSGNKSCSTSAPNKRLESKPLVLSNVRQCLIMATISSLTFAGGISTGVLTIGLPEMSVALDLEPSLQLW